MFVFRVLNTVPYSNEAGAKDLIASIHSFFTVNLLVGLAVLVSWKQFGGKPIECMIPTEFPSAWVQYAENYCWAQDTYFIPPKEVFAHQEDHNRFEQKISYYQWMPFFLLFEAACFKLPCLIWKYFASQSGMRVGEILRMASDDHNAVPEVKKANITALCVHLQGALRFQKRLKLRNIVPHKILRFLNLKYSTHYVTSIYMMSKMAFLMNVILQRHLLHSYLLPNTEQFGMDTWRLLWSSNETWMENGIFPRATLCDFEVREMGQMQTHTVQCVLLLNIFTEKIFFILYIWYIVLTTLTVANLISWLFTIFNDTSKEHFIVKNLEMCESAFDKEDSEDREEVERFVQKYLGLDGCFLLMLIGQHADVVFTTELVGALWKCHYAFEAQRRTLKQMEELLPVTKSINTSPEHMTSPKSRFRNPRDSVPNIRHPMSLKRTQSIDVVEGIELKKFDDTTDSDAEEGRTSKASQRSKDRGSRKGSKHGTPKRQGTLNGIN